MVSKQDVVGQYNRDYHINRTDAIWICDNSRGASRFSGDNQSDIASDNKRGIADNGKVV